MENPRQSFGVTLLEVMLTLAVASMVIVFSIRFYSVASTSAQVNNMLQMAQGIAAAANTLSLKDDSYDNDMVTPSNIQSLMPGNTMITPWGSTAVFIVGTSTNYKVEFPDTPKVICIQASSRLQANSKYTNITPVGSCQSPSGMFSYVYDRLK